MAKIAIVTGAQRGIGRAIAVCLARSGFDIGFTWLEEEHLARETVDEVESHGRRAALLPLDLAQDPAAGARVVDELAEELGGLHAFVNNAGVGASIPFLDLDLETWRRDLDVDLTGAFQCAQSAARRLVEQGRGGTIVNVTSIHERVPLAHAAGYCAAKGGLGLLTKVMALELAEHGITVNAVAPGEIATRMTGQEDVDPHTVRRPAIPAGRPGHAREVGETVAFLTSSGARYITGHSIVVDGGLLLMAAQGNQ